jgi:S-adenosylmethionine:tRNA ribosyltransferase-isomerase
VPLSTAQFDFALPERLIAQHPTSQRDASRLLVVDRRKRRWEHRLFSELPFFLQKGDLLFRNNAAVLPARLSALRSGGGAVECLLLRPASDVSSWWCLLRPGRKLPVGAKFRAEDFQAEVLEKREDGTARVQFATANQESISDVATRIGGVPLPPYITRRGTPEERAEDLLRYQTVYADHQKQVAAAAPTAGLHFTPRLLDELAAQGVISKNVTLHVGLGTFKPISAEAIADHIIHRETFELPVATQESLFNFSRRRVAVGTTTVRSIESFLAEHSGALAHSFTGEAGLFIYPPYSFKGVDALITNFHQPRSTLLCLVSAFLTPGETAGIEWLHEIYQEAIKLEYRFFSYGDAMLIF